MNRAPPATRFATLILAFLAVIGMLPRGPVPVSGIVPFATLCHSGSGDRRVPPPDDAGGACDMCLLCQAAIPILPVCYVPRFEPVVVAAAEPVAYAAVSGTAVAWRQQARAPPATA